MFAVLQTLLNKNILAEYLSKQAWGFPHMMCFVSALPFVLVSWILRVAIIDKLEKSEDIFRKVALSDIIFKITHFVCMVYC